MLSLFTSPKKVESLARIIIEGSIDSLTLDRLFKVLGQSVETNDFIDNSKLFASLWVLKDIVGDTDPCCISLSYNLMLIICRKYLNKNEDLNACFARMLWTSQEINLNDIYPSIVTSALNLSKRFDSDLYRSISGKLFLCGHGDIVKGSTHSAPMEDDKNSLRHSTSRLPMNFSLKSFVASPINTMVKREEPSACSSIFD